jgi:predicted permease
MSQNGKKQRVRLHVWLIRFIGVIVPRRFRVRWRREWEAELEYREELLARWDRLDWRNKLELLWRSLGAFWDALRLQRQRWEDEMIQDLRFGVRMLIKHKGFTAVAVLALALGIGANTAIFSVVNALLLRSLPVKDPDELILLSSGGLKGPQYSLSYPLYEQLRDGGRSFSGLFAATSIWKTPVIAGGTEAEFIRVQGVTGNFFSVLGLSAVRGRTLVAEDDQAGNPRPVVVISYSFWQRRFGADPAAIGKTVTSSNYPFNGRPLTIVGVTPPGFFGFQPGEHPDLWWPVQMATARLLKANEPAMHLMGRLPAGVNHRQAQAEFDLIFQRYLAEDNKSRAYMTEPERRAFLDQKLELQPGAAGYTDLSLRYRRLLFLLLMAVGLVLLIACANVASLLLARAAARKRELTVRSALGARRLRLVRQLLTESIMLAALGGLLGLLLAQAGTRVLQVLMRLEADPVSFNVAPDASVLLFTLGVSLLTGLLFGLAPALRASRIDLALARTGAGGSVAGDASRQRLSQALVVVQVALSLVLLIGAGLFVRTLLKLKATDAGFNRENVVVFNLDFTQRLDSPRVAALNKELLARLETLPGVTAASMSDTFLLDQSPRGMRIIVEGSAVRPDNAPFCDFFMISRRFFETTGTSLVNGRLFGPQDERSAGSSNAEVPRAAVINQAMARRYFGDANPLGRRFYSIFQPEQKYEIVGVVKDMRYKSLREASSATFYVLQNPGYSVTFALLMTSEPGAMDANIRAVVRDVEPTVRVRDLRSMNEVVNTSLHQERVVAQLGGFFSLFALALACLGLYGVLSFAVVQRTREIGVRIALGAQRKDVLALVVGQGLRLAMLGLVLGLVTALAVTRFVASLLYGVTATDPVTFAGVSLLLLVVAGLASWLPARRATKLDPMTVLRHE